MITDIRYSVVVFGQFEDMTPTRDLLQQFSTLMTQYHLENGMAIETELTPQGIKQFTGMRLCAKDGSLVVEFKRGSMEISYINTNINVVETFNYQTFKSFVARAIDVEQLRSRRFKRIGFIHHVLVEGVDHSKAAKNIVHIPCYNSLKMRDDWSVVWPAATELSDKTLVNIHTTISRGKRTILRDSKQEILDGIDIVFDVNTFRENTDYRYTMSTMLDMCDKLQQKEIEVNEDITNLILK